ncbi:MAG: shikimate kinase [Halobacteria archaeon]
MSTGSGVAHGAVSILNALATGRGCALAVSLQTRARVETGRDLKGVEARAWGPEGPVDPRLALLAARNALRRAGHRVGARVQVKSEVPTARGLKSSSAAANAVVAATLDALNARLPVREAVLLGVEAAREAGVTVTGALDDAWASAAGGLAYTDNRRDRLLRAGEVRARVLVLVPPQRPAGVRRRELGPVAPLVRRAEALVRERRYPEAMTLNGLACSAALGYDPRASLVALSHGAPGAGLSGTGPSVAAIVDGRTDAGAIEEAWAPLGRVLRLRTVPRRKR